jgi:heptosyltransferase-2
MSDRTRRLPQPVRSVLVLTKHNFMGDTIVSIPMLRAARQVFPGAKITLLTGKAAMGALQHCPYVDTIVPYAPRDNEYSPLKLRAKLRTVGGRPDVCLVADRSFRSAAIAVLMRGRVRAGFDTEGRGFLLNRPVPYRTDAHEAECCLDILRAVAPEGKDSPPYDASLELWATDEERSQGAAALTERGVDLASGVPLVGIQPGASYPAKQWPAEKFAEVADALTARGARIVLIGQGDAEKESAARMTQAMHGAAPVDLINATKLRVTMGVLPHLSLFIGNDTGVNHMAAGLGVPTIGLFGPTLAYKWGNEGPHNKVLTAPDGELSRLEAAPVIEAANELLGRSGGKRSDVSASLAVGGRR